jgi:hypothetical protein
VQDALARSEQNSSKSIRTIQPDILEAMILFALTDQSQSIYPARIFPSALCFEKDQRGQNSFPRQTVGGFHFVQKDPALDRITRQRDTVACYVLSNKLARPYSLTSHPFVPQESQSIFEENFLTTMKF